LGPTFVMSSFSGLSYPSFSEIPIKE